VREERRAMYTAGSWGGPLGGLTMLKSWTDCRYQLVRTIGNKRGGLSMRVMASWSFVSWPILGVIWRRHAPQMDLSCLFDLTIFMESDLRC